MLSRGDCVSSIMTGVSSSERSAVVLTPWLVQHQSTLRRIMEDRVMGDSLTAMINCNLYRVSKVEASDLFLNLTWKRGGGFCFFSHNSIHPQQTCETKEWTKQ